MGEDLKKDELLLELAFHRYEEEERRNQLIDSKNQSFVAFLGVMFTIQITMVSNFHSMFENIDSNKINFLLVCFIISIICYFISLIFFSSTLMFTDKFKSAPSINKIIKFGKSEEDCDFIIGNTGVSLKDSIDNNKKILDFKASQGNFGFLFINIGLFFTILFILYYLFSTFWCCYV